MRVHLILTEGVHAHAVNCDVSVVRRMEGHVWLFLSRTTDNDPGRTLRGTGVLGGHCHRLPAPTGKRVDFSEKTGAGIIVSSPVHKQLRVAFHSLDHG